MAKKNGLKDLDIRIKLPWKEDPKKAHRLYKQITRSDEPEQVIKRLKKSYEL